MRKVFPVTPAVHVSQALEVVAPNLSTTNHRIDCDDEQHAQQLLNDMKQFL